MFSLINCSRTAALKIYRLSMTGATGYLIQVSVVVFCRCFWVENCSGFFQKFPLFASFGFLAYDWGMTSEWFTLESSLLTLCITGAAMLFVNDRTKKNARRMFNASLLYLPVFMAGLLLHRLPNDQQEAMLAGLSETEGHTLISETEELLEDNSSSHRSRKT